MGNPGDGQNRMGRFDSPSLRSRLSSIPPPYVETRPFSPPLRRGTVVLLPFPLPGLPTSELPRFSEVLRRAHGVPVVLRVDPVVDPVKLVAVLRHPQAFSGVVQASVDPELETTLRKLLADPDRLAERVVSCLSLLRPLDPPSKTYIQLIVGAASAHPGVTRLLHEHGLTARTVRGHLHRAGLPPAGRFHTLARLLEAQLLLQRNPTLPLDTVARMYGYVEAVSMANQLRRLFRVSAGEARHLLGLEWRLKIWWSNWGGASTKL